MYSGPLFDLAYHFSTKLNNLQGIHRDEKIELILSNRGCLLCSSRNLFARTRPPFQSGLACRGPSTSLAHFQLPQCSHSDEQPHERSVEVLVLGLGPHITKGVAVAYTSGDN